MVPEIMNMLAHLPVPVAGITKCESRRGWLPAGFDDRCREIIHELVLGEIQKRKDQTESQNDKGSDSTDENDDCPKEVYFILLYSLDPIY